MKNDDWVISYIENNDSNWLELRNSKLHKVKEVNLENIYDLLEQGNKAAHKLIKEFIK